MTKYEIMNKICDLVKNTDTDDFINLYVKVTDIEKVVTDGYLPIGGFELDLNNGRVEYQGTSMGGSSELYFKIQDIKDRLLERVA